MSITPTAPEKLPASQTSMRPEWIYPGMFRRIAGPPPSLFTLPEDAQIGSPTDWVRNPDGSQLRRYPLNADQKAQAPQIDYVDRYAKYQGEFDMALIPVSVLDSANAVYAKWGMGEMRIHLFSNPKVPAQVSWANAPTYSRYLPNFDTAFVAWAKANRPSLLMDPFGGSNPITCLTYPDKMVVQYQEAAVQSGLAIAESLLHPGVPPMIRKKNDALLAAQAKALEELLKDLFPIA